MTHSTSLSQNWRNLSQISKRARKTNLIQFVIELWWDLSRIVRALVPWRIILSLASTLRRTSPGSMRPRLPQRARIRLWANSQAPCNKTLRNSTLFKLRVMSRHHRSQRKSKGFQRAQGNELARRATSSQLISPHKRWMSTFSWSTTTHMCSHGRQTHVCSLKATPNMTRNRVMNNRKIKQSP